MKSEVEIYDTTLRDGSQGEGINFSVADKLRIAERIDAFGIHYIEGGWPGSNPKDIEFFGQARRKKFKHAKLAAFGATRRKSLRVEDDDQVRLLLEAGTPVVTIVGKTWLLHVKEVLRTTAEENLAMIGDTIRYLKDHGKFVLYDAEHSFDGFSDETVLGVVEDKFAVVFEIANRVADHRQIFLRRRAQHFLHVQQPGFPDDGNDGGSGFEQQPHLVVGFDAHDFAPSGAKGREFGVLELFAPGLAKEFNVFRIGPGPAPFDVVNAEGVDSLGNAELVGNREVDAFTLAAVTQGRIVYFHLGFHTSMSLTTSS